MAGETQDYTGSFSRAASVGGLPPFIAFTNVTVPTTSGSFDCVVCHQAVTMVVVQVFGTAPTSVSHQLQGSHDNVNWVGVGAALTGTTNGAVSQSVNGIAFRYFRVASTWSGGTSPSVSATIGAAA